MLHATCVGCSCSVIPTGSGTPGRTAGKLARQMLAGSRWCVVVEASGTGELHP